MDSDTVKALARDCGFELAGIAAAEPAEDRHLYARWVKRGMAGAMGYLTGRRAEVRMDPQRLMPRARSIICVGKLYNGPEPYSTSLSQESEHGRRIGRQEVAWIARYAWGDDYHRTLRRGLEDLAARMREAAGRDFDYRVCVDTAPLLERSYARLAGLGWIGRNTCLINQDMGSWFFLGELMTSLDLDVDAPPPDRCGTCTRCIEACPTAAIVRDGDGYTLDARRCISYFTIELGDAIPEEYRGPIGSHVFGCDICQDVCPWNGRAPVTRDIGFAPRHFAPPLEKLAALGEDEFMRMFGDTAVERARYRGFLRNVAVAMGNSGSQRFREPLERLAESRDELVAEHARWALERIVTGDATPSRPAVPE